MVSPTLEVRMSRSKPKPSSRSKPAKAPKGKSKRNAGLVSAFSSGKTKHDQILSMLHARAVPRLPRLRVRLVGKRILCGASLPAS